MSVIRATALFALLTAVFTWPQVLHPLSVPENIDAYFNMWRIAWIAHQLPLDPSRLFDANIFYPVQHTFAFSDGVLLPGIVALPFLKLGVPVVAVANGLIFAGFLLSAVGMFLLVRDLTGKSAPAVLAGIVFAFAPFRFDHYFHLEMVWAQWMPFTMWMVHRAFKSGRWVHGLMAGLFLAMQGYSSVYYTVFLASGLILAGPLLIWKSPPSIRWSATASLVVGGLLAGVLLIPYLSVYQKTAAETGGRSKQEALYAYAAGPKHYLAPMPSSLVYGKVTGSIGTHEKRLFPGFVVALLALVALWPPLDRWRVAYLLIVLFAVDISFAHRGWLQGWLYDHVFAYRGLRVPPRIGQLFLLGLGVLAAFGLARLSDSLRDRRWKWAGLVAPVAIGLTVIEYAAAPVRLVPVSTRESAVTSWLRDQKPGPVAEFPAPGPTAEGIPEVLYQYESTFHWLPLLNGYSGMYPTKYVEWIEEMRDFPAEQAIEGLEARGVKYLIVHERYYERGDYQRIVQALSTRTDLVSAGPFPDGSFETRAYRLLKAR